MKGGHLLRAFLLVAALHGVAAALPGVATAQPPDTLPSDPARDAYLDQTARRLVLGARAVRDTTRLGIESHTALIRERIGFEAPALRRDRPLVSGERVARVRWSRHEPNVVHILGARFRHAGVRPEDFPEFFAGLQAERFAADPFGDPFVFGFGPPVGGELGTSAVAVESPLETGSERHYQFRSGDTIQVRLDDDRTVEAIAVTVIPRYRSIRLVAAMLWIDADSFGLVRVAHRPAKKVDREVSGRLWEGGKWRPRVWIDDGSVLADSSPGTPTGFFARTVNQGVDRMVGRVEVDLSAVVVDFGQWEGRRWVPRSVRWMGYLGLENVSATGYVPPAVPVTVEWALETESVRERGVAEISVAPATAAEALTRWRQSGDRVGGDVESRDPSETVTITAADGRALTSSELLPPSVWEDTPSAPRDSGLEADEAPVDELEGLLAAIGTGQGGDAREAANPWFFYPPVTTLGLMRYNPVEGVSTGTQLRRDFGWWRSVLTVRVATRHLTAPDIDLSLQRDHPRRRVQFSLYRALRGGALGVGGSKGWPGYYVTATDSVDFHWSHGATLRFIPGNGRRNHLALSLFAERDGEVETDAERTRVGASVEWKPWWGGLDSGSVTGGGRVGVRGSAGDNPHVKAVATGALVVPLAARASLGLRAGVAGVWGEPAAQDLWEVGGTGRWIRGQKNAVETSRTWMGRVDLQRAVHSLHLSVFGDWASAGGADFCSVGVGLAFMDGIVRLDLARGLQCGGSGPTESVWRFHPLVDAFF